MTIDLESENAHRLGIVKGPHWTDGCEHPSEFYVCTFEVIGKFTEPPRVYDLYVFPEKFFGHEVCIRYGHEGHEYISPGGLGQFMRTAGIYWDKLPEYRMAAEILQDLGRFRWEARNP